MDTDGNGVTEVEFLCWCLVEFGKVTESDIQAVLCKFHEADKSGDGLLTSADLENVDFDILSHSPVSLGASAHHEEQPSQRSSPRGVEKPAFPVLGSKPEAVPTVVISPPPPADVEEREI